MWDRSMDGELKLGYNLDFYEMPKLAIVLSIFISWILDIPVGIMFFPLFAIAMFCSAKRECDLTYDQITFKLRGIPIKRIDVEDVSNIECAETRFALFVLLELKNVLAYGKKGSLFGPILYKLAHPFRVKLIYINKGWLKRNKVVQHIRGWTYEEKTAKEEMARLIQDISDYYEIIK